jgi:hypothetical protein
MRGWLMNNELESMRKEKVELQFKLLTQHLPEGLMEKP